MTECLQNGRFYQTIILNYSSEVKSKLSEKIQISEDFSAPDLQTLNRATTPLARYGTVHFLHGTFRFLHGTFCFLHGMVRFLHGTFRFLQGTVRFLHVTVRFLHGTVRFCLRHDLLNGMQISRQSLLGLLLNCSFFSNCAFFKTHSTVTRVLYLLTTIKHFT